MIPFYDEHGIVLQRILTDRGTEFCIRRAIYTTNAIESLNASLRRVTKKCGVFPTPDAVRKVLHLAIERVSARWTRPIKNWTAALNHFAIAFAGRVEL